MVAGLPLALGRNLAGAGRRAARADHDRGHQFADREGGSQDGDSPSGFEARASPSRTPQGGIHGHKLVPLYPRRPDQPGEHRQRGEQAADSKAFGSCPEPAVLPRCQIPEPTGGPRDRLRRRRAKWGTKPYTNMFAADEGSVNPKYPVNTQIGDFLKAHGGTVPRLVRLLDLAFVEPGRDRDRRIVPARRGQGRGAQHLGPLRQRGLHQSTALVAKEKGVNAMVPAMDANSNYALAQALKQSGVDLKATLYATGLSALRHQVARVEHAAGRTTSRRRFAPVVANAGDPADAGRHGEYGTSPRIESPISGQYEAWAGRTS